MRTIKTFENYVAENAIKKLWNKLFGLKRGDVVLREGTGRGSDDIYLLLEPIDGTKERVEVFEIGSFARNVNNERYCSLVYNTKTAQPASIAANSPEFKSYRPLTKEEKKMYKEEIKSGEFSRYISKTKELTGIQLK